MADEVSVELAKAQIFDGVQLQGTAPESIEVAAGTPLLLRLVYTLDDQRKTQEKWEFHLAHDVNGEDGAQVDRIIIDDKLAADDAISFLGDERVFGASGAYTLNFHARASVARRPWDGDEEFVDMDGQEVRGQLIVHVK